MSLQNLNKTDEDFARSNISDGKNHYYERPAIDLLIDDTGRRCLEKINGNNGNQREDFGEEAPCDVPVLKSAPLDVNNEVNNMDQNLISDTDSKVSPSPCNFDDIKQYIHAIGKHGYPLVKLWKHEDEDVDYLEVLNKDCEASKILEKQKQEENRNKLNNLNYEESMEEEIRHVIDESVEGQAGSDLSVDMNNTDLEQKNAAVVTSMQMNFDSLLKHSLKLQQFHHETLNSPPVPVYFIGDVKKRSIVAYRKLPQDRYVKFIMADGTGNLKAGQIITAFMQKSKDLKKLFSNKESSKKWINLSTKEMMEIPPENIEEPGIYILVNENSVNHLGLEELFPNWLTVL